jgi:hypothetical protein
MAQRMGKAGPVPRAPVQGDRLDLLVQRPIEIAGVAGDLRLVG